MEGNKHCMDCEKRIDRHYSLCPSCCKKGSRNAFYGKKHTPENIKLFSIINKGKNVWLNNPHPEETKRKISLALKGRPSPKKGIHYKEIIPILKQCPCCNNQMSPHAKRCRQCVNNEKKEKGMPIETRKKLSLAHIGKKISEETRKKMSLSGKGRVFSKQHLLNLSKSLSGKKNPMFGRSGELSSNWKGGKSFEPYTIDFNKHFKDFIKLRDEYACLICNAHEEELKRGLNVHHIDYNKLNTFKENCITLCGPCHMRTNVNREHWKIFFQSILKEKFGYDYTQDQKIILNYY